MYHEKDTKGTRAETASISRCLGLDVQGYTPYLTGPLQDLGGPDGGQWRGELRSGLLSGDRVQAHSFLHAREERSRKNPLAAPRKRTPTGLL